jgi:hypothetical protein
LIVFDVVVAETERLLRSKSKGGYVSLAPIIEVPLSGSGCLYVWSKHLEVPMVDVRTIAGEHLVSLNKK